LNTTEERLRDALQSVGETVRPENVPDPRFIGRRRGLPRPAMAMAAVAASAAVVVGGVAVGGTFRSGGATGPLAQPSASGASVPTISVFLCVKTSGNPSCDHKDATDAQRRKVKQRLEGVGSVRQVEFENKQEAYERFKKRFPNDDQFRRSVEAGDIPESFRVSLAPGADTGPVTKAMTGTPGVDKVIVEGR
jgi:cell division protein FtsX